MRNLLVTSAVVASLAAIAAPHASAASSAVSVVCQRDLARFTSSSSTAEAKFNYPPFNWLGDPILLQAEGAELSALADASTQTLRALNSVGIDGTHGDNDCTVTSSITDTAVVLPGGGFTAGTPVRLLFTPGFHLGVEAGPLPYAPSSLTSVDGFAQVDLGGLASFAAQFDELIDASGPHAFFPNGLLTRESSWSWRLNSNVAAQISDRGSYDADLCLAWPCAFAAIGGIPVDPTGLTVSTGSQAIEFEVVVGRPFDVSATFDALTQASEGAGRATANVLNTLHFALAPAPGYEGVTVAYESSAHPDTTPPVIACGSADGTWHAENVSIACTARDGDSGLADGADAAFSLATSVPDGTETAAAATDSRRVCDKAGNCATAGPIGANEVDRRPPSLTIVAPTGRYVLGQTVTPDLRCDDAGSGIASCFGVGEVDTSTAGGHAYTGVARDNVGHETRSSSQYDVVYAVCVLTDLSRAAKAGSTIPIRLHLCDAAGRDVSAPSLVLHAIDGTAPGSSQPGNDFRWVDGAYQYNLKTTGVASGTHELRFTVGGDAATYAVSYSVR